VIQIVHEDHQKDWNQNKWNVNVDLNGYAKVCNKVNIHQKLEGHAANDSSHM
jgi:hypothetical protein